MAEPRVEIKVRLPGPLYDQVVQRAGGESMNAFVVRALRSALEARHTPDPVGTEKDASRTVASAQTQVLDETVASPCCGADLNEHEGRRFCSDCGTLVPS